MTSRERFLSIGLVGFLALAGLAAGYFLVLRPLRAKEDQAQTLRGEISDLDTKVMGLVKNRPALAEVKRQSLPPDRYQATAQYRLLLENLLEEHAKIPRSRFTIPREKILDSRAPATPELAPKKPAYTRLEFRIDIKQATIWQVADFLAGFSRVNLLHQITSVTIARDNKPTESRDGLEVHITCEAIIVEGAEPRATLFATARQPAAVAGVAGDLARQVALAPVLAARPRDYSFLALQDIFYGPLPTEKKEPPFYLYRLSDVVLKPEEREKPPEVKVRLSGEGSAGGKVVATATGDLLPAGELKVDPKTLAITLPVPMEEAEPTATSTISVVATSAEGKTLKGSFKVSLAKPKEEPKAEPPKPDISGSIKLRIASTGDDGTARVVIRDDWNPFKYEVTAGPKKVEVVKYWPAGKLWKPDRDYEQPPGVLFISDELSATTRTLKVVAVDNDGLVVLDLKPAAAPAKPAAPRPGRFGPRPPGGPRVTPTAVITGAANAVAAAIEPSAVYRWGLGQSLKEMTRIPPAEAAKILERAASGGPVGAAVSAAN